MNLPYPRLDCLFFSLHLLFNIIFNHWIDFLIILEGPLNHLVVFTLIYRSLLVFDKNYFKANMNFFQTRVRTSSIHRLSSNVNATTLSISQVNYTGRRQNFTHVGQFSHVLPKRLQANLIDYIPELFTWNQPNVLLSRCADGHQRRNFLDFINCITYINIKQLHGIVSIATQLPPITKYSSHTPISDGEINKECLNNDHANIIPQIENSPDCNQTKKINVKETKMKSSFYGSSILTSQHNGGESIQGKSNDSGQTIGESKTVDNLTDSTVHVACKPSRYSKKPLLPGSIATSNTVQFFKKSLRTNCRKNLQLSKSNCSLKDHRIDSATVDLFANRSPLSDENKRCCSKATSIYSSVNSTLISPSGLDHINHDPIHSYKSKKFRGYLHKTMSVSLKTSKDETNSSSTPNLCISGIQVKPSIEPFHRNTCIDTFDTERMIHNGQNNSDSDGNVLKETHIYEIDYPPLNKSLSVKNECVSTFKISSTINLSLNEASLCINNEKPTCIKTYMALDFLEDNQAWYKTRKTKKLSKVQFQKVHLKKCLNDKSIWECVNSYYEIYTGVDLLEKVLLKNQNFDNFGNVNQTVVNRNKEQQKFPKSKHRKKQYPRKSKRERLTKSENNLRSKKLNFYDKLKLKYQLMIKDDEECNADFAPYINSGKLLSNCHSEHFQLYSGKHKMSKKDKRRELKKRKKNRKLKRKHLHATVVENEEFRSIEDYQKARKQARRQSKKKIKKEIRKSRLTKNEELVLYILEQ